MGHQINTISILYNKDFPEYVFSGFQPGELVGSARCFGDCLRHLLAKYFTRSRWCRQPSKHRVLSSLLGWNPEKTWSVSIFVTCTYIFNCIETMCKQKKEKKILPWSREGTIFSANRDVTRSNQLATSSCSQTLHDCYDGDGTLKDAQHQFRASRKHLLVKLRAIFARLWRGNSLLKLRTLLQLGGGKENLFCHSSWTRTKELLWQYLKKVILVAFDLSCSFPELEFMWYLSYNLILSVAWLLVFKVHF